MLIHEYQGMKFPTEYLTRFFFKESLHLRPGRVLELGCGNGNNLMLFYQYGWDISGVDLSPVLIEQAQHNFALLKERHALPNRYTLQDGDMLEFVRQYPGTPFDVLTLPHSVYYLPRERIEELFRLLLEKRMVTEGSLLFLTVRTPKDYRFGRGNPAGDGCFVLDIEETGEKGSTVTFFSEPEIRALLEKYFGFSHLLVLHQEYENPQSGRIIANSDLTLWGKVEALRRPL